MTIQGVSAPGEAHYPLVAPERVETDTQLISYENFIDSAVAENDAIAPLKDRVFITTIIPQNDSNGQPVYKIELRVDLSLMPTLSRKTKLIDNNDLVSAYLNELYHILNKRGMAATPQTRFAITHVELQNNNVSGRSLLQSLGDLIKGFNGHIEHPAFKAPDPAIAFPSPIERNKILYDDTKQDIRYADYSHTFITYKGLKYMFRLPNLLTLKMDYCPEATYIQDVNKYPCKTVRVISLLGAALCNVETFLKDLEQKLPSIERIDFTQPTSEDGDNKFIGFLDIATERSTVSPHAVVPCGHVYSRINAVNQLGTGCCWTCRKEVENIVNASIFQTRLEKTESTWKVEILDFLRNPIDSPTLYHPDCRQAFNAKTISQIFKISFEGVPLIDLASAVANKVCPACELQGMVNPMKLLPIYPVLTEKDDDQADSQHQESLASASEYIHTDV